MAMAERMEHVRAAARRPDHRQAVRGAGPVPHPDLHPIGRQVARQVWERAQGEVAQDRRPAPVWRCIQARQLDLPGDPQSAAGHRDRHLAVAGHDRTARSGAGRGDDGVVAALALEADPVPGRQGQRAGACAGGDHGRTTGHVAHCRRDRHQPARLNAEPGGGCPHPHGAERNRMVRQRRDIGAGIGAVAAGLDQHAERVTPVEFGLLLAQFVLIEFQPLHTVIPAQPPGQGFGLEGGAARKNVEQASPFDEFSDSGLLGKLAVPLGRVGDQRAQGSRDGFHPRHRRPGPHEAQQPRRQLRQITPSDCQWAKGIGQEPWNPPPEARRSGRNHRTRA